MTYIKTLANSHWLFRILNKFLKIPIAGGHGAAWPHMPFPHFLGFLRKCLDPSVRQIAAPALLSENSGLQPLRVRSLTLKKIG